jgi:hypothetical protein
VNKSLYTDKNTENEIERLAELDSDDVIYNLYEDILILREQLSSANIEIKDLKQRLKIASDANEHIMEYVKELEAKTNE